jgi:hypothetical protein
MNKISRTNQRGGANLKFLLVVAVIAAVGYAGYLFLPVMYQVGLYKDLMQHNVDVASTQGYPPSWVTDQLKKSGPEFGIPVDASITAINQDNRIEARVQFTQPIPFPGYTYVYEFDHTAKSTAFLTTK